jgi:hypothetical protein
MYYDSDADSYGRRHSDDECMHDERYYDERTPFVKLAELDKPVPPHRTQQTPTHLEATSLKKTLLDAYISDSDDSYTEEELVEYAKSYMEKKKKHLA